MVESREKTLKRLHDAIKDTQNLRSKLEKGKITSAEALREMQKMRTKIEKIISVCEENLAEKYEVSEVKSLGYGEMDFGRCIFDGVGEYNRCTTRNCEKCEHMKQRQHD